MMQRSKTLFDVNKSYVNHHKTLQLIFAIEFINSEKQKISFKKIIQENQEIGKLSNLVPPLVEKSLQFFLNELIKKS